MGKIRRSKIGRISERDRRTVASREFERRYAALIDQLGGPSMVSPAQATLVEVAATLYARKAEFDGRAFRDGGLRPEDVDGYVRITSALSRTLRAVGFKVAAPRVPTAVEYLATRRAAR
jgi:hypothetical protein